MSELVSIVIPAFNTEHEIEKCIEALVQQTYLNYEVILINDGSTDNTAAICDSLAEKNDKIVVIHQENAGVSSARNAGLKLARGKWIVFLDADDHMAPEAIEKALMLAEEQNCDTVCWNCFSECDGEVKEYPSIRPNGGIYQGKEMKCVLTEALYYTRKESFYPGMMFRAVWGKLLSADVIRKNAIMFPVGLLWGRMRHFWPTTSMRARRYCLLISTGTIIESRQILRLENISRISDSYSCKNWILS